MIEIKDREWYKNNATTELKSPLSIKSDLTLQEYWINNEGYLRYSWWRDKGQREVEQIKAGKERKDHSSFMKKRTTIGPKSNTWWEEHFPDEKKKKKAHRCRQKEIAMFLAEENDKDLHLDKPDNFFKLQGYRRSSTKIYEGSKRCFLESTKNHVCLRLLCCHTKLREIIILSYFPANWEMRTGNEHSNELNEDINLEDYKYSHKAKHKGNAFMYVC